MNEVNLIVKNLIEKHVGGSVFFDHLDEALRNEKTIIDALIQKLPKSKFITYVVSGQFGEFFESYYLNHLDSTKDILILPGNLRQADYILDLTYVRENLYKKFIFIDDSFYSGKTRNVISWALTKCYKKSIDCSYVIYNGSKTKDPKVISLYRYYDHYK